MPIIEKSSYRAPFFFLNAHAQTICPSYTRKLERVNYTREAFNAPDGLDIYLDWSKVGADNLVVVSHGLCGNTGRHYALSTVKSFNDAGWDAVAWNYRGTGQSPVKGMNSMTSSNASEHLAWVVEHAILSGHYKKVALVGFSMGGNLSTLYLSREADRVPDEVIGSVSFCATIDLNASSRCFNSFMGKVYFKHFFKRLRQIVIDVDRNNPGQLDISRLDSVRSIGEYDNLYTAPISGFRNAEEYWTTSSAWRWLHKLKTPTLIVNPKNDPFLDGKCYPVAEAEKNDNLFLEMPSGGGHCGFVTCNSSEWWPMTRAKEFLLSL